jgi:predicted YcjX-like family ATPase
MGADMHTDENRHSNEDSMLALDLIDAAWSQAKENGVPHELMAYAAVFTGMRDLVAMFGETAVAAMAKNLETRIKQGDFSDDPTALH